MPHAALWVVQPRGGIWLCLLTSGFNAARGYSLSPPPPLRGPPPPLTQGRLGYAPFSRRITQYQLPPPMRGKWRAQRADRGAHAARGFVGGAAEQEEINRLVEIMFQCRTRLCGWCNVEIDDLCKWIHGFNAARGFVGGATSWSPMSCGMGSCFNAARGFVGGAAQHLPLY